MDSNSITRNTNGLAKQQYFHLPVLQTKAASKVTDSNLNFCGEKKQPFTVQPLDAVSKNKSIFSAERKFPERINIVPSKVVAQNANRKLPSKIPVLKKTTLLHSVKKDETVPLDTLSAADKRQKFYQSRLRVAPMCLSSVSTFHPQERKILQCTDIIPWWEARYEKHTHVPYSSVISICQKNVLPPIKSVTSNTTTVNATHAKKKCLLGEITHFPALCNGLKLKPQKIASISSVPHLPPITLPPPPPPSISTSMEHKGKK